jgi:hypothetical protein
LTNYEYHELRFSEKYNKYKHIGIKNNNHYNDNQWNNHHKKTNKNSSKNKNQKRLTKRSNSYLINLTFKELKKFLDGRIDKEPTNDPSLNYNVDKDGFENTRHS